jgi:hypothetical protein
MSGPFANAAMELRDYGLAPIPLGGDDGKHPKLKFKAWTTPPPRQDYINWCARYADENIGVVTGPPSGVFVADADERGLESKIEERFGPTPLWVLTPRGTHAYYRYTNERCGNLRKEGLPVDLKGLRGIAILPPSVRRHGEFAGRRYELRLGCSWDMLRDLPRIKPGVLPRAPVSVSESGQRAVPEGRRNDALFRHLLKAAPHVDDLDTLIDVARTFVGQRCDRGGEIVDDDEILKTARCAWGYEQRGENWVGKERMIGRAMPASQFAEVRQHPNAADAYLMLGVLQDLNWQRKEFSASPAWFQTAQTIPGWRRERYRYALSTLVELQLIRVTHRGGGRNGDPRLYRFV